MPSSEAPVHEALERWLAALHGLGALSPVQAAFRPDAVVLRYGWDEGRGLQRERFEGHEAIAAWCARTPREVRFELDGAPAPCPAGWAVRYAVLLGDYRNGGRWELALDAGGRITHLAHQPDDLPAEWRDGIPAGKQLPALSPDELERAREQALEAAARRQAGLPSALDGAGAAHGHEHSHDDHPAHGHDRPAAAREPRG